MLDSNLAKLYGYVNGTKTINQSVKRNIDRFPEDFYFQLTNEEFSNLKSQFGTSSLNGYGGVRKNPYVFIEQGVAMKILNCYKDLLINLKQRKRK